MKLKLKKLSLDAGRPVAFIGERDAHKLNIHVGDRVELNLNKKSIIAIVDIVKGFIPPGEISLSKEIIEYLHLKDGGLVDVNLSIEPRSSVLIAKKLCGGVLSREDIFLIVRDMVSNSLTEAEIAYFVSAVYQHGMSLQETIYLTEAMYKTGKILSWHSPNIVDKHSIGGIPGNRTTPIVVSICAAAGIIMPKTSSRAITSAAGTADVIETIANVEFSSDDLQKIVKKTGACLAWGGSLGLAPSDDKLIRVERLLNLDPESQLIASILAKKLAVGSKHVLIDIPFGKNAKVTKEHAEKLKNKFIQIGKHFNLDIKIVLTDGNQPIGNGVGPVLEMLDVLRVLECVDSPQDLEKKAIMLAGIILEMTRAAPKGKGESEAREILESGRALIKFNEIIDAQGRKNGKPKLGKFRHNLKASKSGKIIAINNKEIALLGRILGCPSDKSAGLYLYKHLSDSVKKGDMLLTLYAESERKLEEAISFLKESGPIIIKSKNL